MSHDDPGYQFERDREGRLLASPTGGQSGRRSGFRLPDATLRSPAAAWIRKERWDGLSEEEREGFPSLTLPTNSVRSVEGLTLNREIHPPYDVIHLDEGLAGFSLDLRGLDPSPA